MIFLAIAAISACFGRLSSILEKVYTIMYLMKEHQKRTERRCFNSKATVPCLGKNVALSFVLK